MIASLTDSHSFTMYLTKIIELNLKTDSSYKNQNSTNSEHLRTPSIKPFSVIRYERLDRIRQECNCDKISIITFLGESQTGKTFLIESLMNVDTFEPKCQNDYGIWLSSKPIYVFESGNGEKIGVFLMDTPGICDEAIINNIILSFIKKVSSVIVMNMFTDQLNYFNKHIKSNNIVYVLRDYKNNFPSTNNVQFIGIPYPGITVNQQRTNMNMVTNEFKFMVDNLFITLIKHENIKSILIDWNDFRKILRKFSQKDVNVIETTKVIKFPRCNIM